MERLLLVALLPISAVLVADSPRKEISTLVDGHDKYVPLVIIGEGWSQQFIIKNADPDPAAGTLKFFTRDGDPWDVEVQGMGVANSFDILLSAGQMAFLETAVKFHGQILGFARIEFGCCPDIVAQSIFRRQEAGRPDLLTSIPVTDHSLETLHIPFDNRGGKFAGVGFLATDSCFESLNMCETRMRIRVRDADGSVVDEQVRTQRNQTLHWFALSSEFPASNGRLGSIEITDGDDSDSFDFVSMVGFSLQFTPNAAFTAIATFEQ